MNFALYRFYWKQTTLAFKRAHTHRSGNSINEKSNIWQKKSFSHLFECLIRAHSSTSWRKQNLPRSRNIDTREIMKVLCTKYQFELFWDTFVRNWKTLPVFIGVLMCASARAHSLFECAPIDCHMLPHAWIKMKESEIEIDRERERAVGGFKMNERNLPI